MTSSFHKLLRFILQIETKIEINQIRIKNNFKSKEKKQIKIKERKTLQILRTWLLSGSINSNRE
jgi:hypothetical protein